MKKICSLNSIIRKVHLIAPLILLFVSLSIAQNTASTGVQVNASVIQGITLAVSGTLNFNNAVAGTTPNAINPNTATGIPLYTATANGGSILTVSWSTPLSLTGPGTALSYTPSLVGSQSSGSQSTASSVTNGGTVTISGSSGSAGNYYFWVGGSLAAIPSGQTPGSYSGTFTLTVHY